jgi:hypothetical protein
MEHLPGWIILGLSAASIIIFTVVRIVQWRRRWDVDEYNGIRVRYDHGAVSTPTIGAELDAATKNLHDTLNYFFPARPELLDYRIEIVTPGNIRTPTVPAGKLPDGSLVGGSIRTERCFPITRKHWVAVVVNERVGAFVIHEVARHITAFHVLGHPDAPHQDKTLAELESVAKRDLREALEGRART